MNDLIVSPSFRRGPIELEPYPPDEVSTERDGILLVLRGEGVGPKICFDAVQGFLVFALRMEKIAHFSLVEIAFSDGDFLRLLGNGGKIQVNSIP